MSAVDYCANISLKRNTCNKQLKLEGSIQSELTKSTKWRPIDNNKFKSNDIGLEHKRKLLFEVLKQRKILTDPETGKVINEDTQLQTLLKIILNEKYHDNIETKRVPEAFPSVNKLKTFMTFPYYTSAYNLLLRKRSDY